MSAIAWLFDDAWTLRRRRHRRYGLWLALVVSAALTVFVARPFGGAGAPGAGTQVAFEQASRVLTQQPYMGVHCPVANSIACDQVGLAVMLKQPAISVLASIDGRQFKLNRRGDVLDRSPRPRVEFDGFLQPAGIVSRMHVHTAPGSDFWAPDLRQPDPTAAVRLQIDYGNGRIVVTRLRVALSAGWG
jgi:hypothetical protein